jgi:hypothetical protein
MAFFRNVLGLNRDDLILAVFMEPNAFPDSFAKAYGSKNPERNILQNALKSFLTHLSRHFPFRPWPYLALTIIVIVVCLALPTLEKLQIALIAASGLAHELGLFLVAPAIDFRYSHYMIYTSVLAFLLFLKTRSGKSTRSAGAVTHAKPAAGRNAADTIRDELKGKGW